MTGALTLANYPFDPIRVACRRCDRRGQYRRSSLVALYGERAPLPDVLAHLAHDCPKRSGIRNEACGAYFPDFVEGLVRPKRSARKWFESWRTTREFCDATHGKIRFIPLDEPLPQYLRDAFVAGAFAWIRDKHSRFQVRIPPETQQFPDAELRCGDMLFDLEATVADKKDRPMWEEHKIWAAMLAEGKVPLSESSEAQRAYAREAIPRICAKKAAKHYAGRRPTHLLIYLNVGSTLLSTAEMGRLTEPWKERFGSIWLLCGSDAVRTWPTQRRLRADAPAPFWSPPQ